MVLSIMTLATLVILVCHCEHLYVVIERVQVQTIAKYYDYPLVTVEISTGKLVLFQSKLTLEYA